jgi:hypothetical protein
MSNWTTLIREYIKSLNIALGAAPATAFETLTVTNAVAKILTAVTYGTATNALITVEGNSVRVRWDGTAPTTTVGHLCVVGTMLEIAGHDITHFKAISVGADATLSVTYSEES